MFEKKKTLFENSSTRKDILAGILALILFVNTALFAYGAGIHIQSETNPFLNVLLISSFIGIHLPLAYDLFRILRKKPLSLFGSYLTMMSLPVSIMLSIPLIIIGTISYGPLIIGALAFAFLLTISVIFAFVIESYGLPLLFFAQVIFWLMLAPKLILPEIQTPQPVSKYSYFWHPDLRKKLTYKILFVTLCGLYIFLGFFIFMAFSAWLTPPDAGIWDSWIF